MFPVFLLLVTLQTLEAAETIISVPNGETWGHWGPMEVCDNGTETRAFQLKVQRWQGPSDDTALNGIALHCTKPSSSLVVKIVRSTEGPFGSWGPLFWCNSGYLKYFSLRVAPRKVWDNTAANNIKFTCSDGSVKEGNGLSWGSYGPWSSSCEKGIHGIQTRVKGRQGIFRDDVSLTDVKFMCSNGKSTNQT